jgi:hypothetical protein
MCTNMFNHGPNWQRNAVQDVDRTNFVGLTMAVLPLKFCLVVSFGLKFGFILVTCGFQFVLNSVASTSRHLQLTTKLLCSHCQDPPPTLCITCLLHSCLHFDNHSPNQFVQYYCIVCGNPVVQQED